MSEPKQIFIRTVDNRTITVEVSDDETVTSLKQKLQDKEGIPANQQRLVFGGKQMQDGRSLSDYAVTKEATIYLVLKLVGGF